MRLPALLVALGAACTLAVSAAAAPAPHLGTLVFTDQHAVYALHPGAQTPQRLLGVPRHTQPLGISRDGRTLLWYDWRKPSIYDTPIVVSDQHGSSRRLVGYGSFAELSNNGRWVVFSGQEPGCTNDRWASCRELAIVRSDGSGERILLRHYPGIQPVGCFSPDGSRLAVVHGRRLFFLTPDGHRVGRTFDLPIKDPLADPVYQMIWAPHQIVLAYGQFPGAWILSLDPTTATVQPEGSGSEWATVAASPADAQVAVATENKLLSLDDYAALDDPDHVAQPFFTGRARLFMLGWTSS